jgi:phosphopantetheinyl transferase
MLSTIHNLADGASIAAGLRNFLVSQTPDKHLSITLIDADDLKNGAIHELADTFLNEPEKRQLETFTFEKRRYQWLLGRVCAKRSVLNLIDPPGEPPRFSPLDITIAVAADGRPIAALRSTTKLHPLPGISISHSGRKIVALAANALCGIDIQLLTDTLFKVRDRFCSDKESTMLHEAINDELPQLGMLWSAKESVRKCLGEFTTIGFLAMELTRIEHHQSCAFLELQLNRSCPGVDSVTVVASVEDGYCLSACIVPKAPDHA